MLQSCYPLCVLPVVDPGNVFVDGGKQCRIVTVIPSVHHHTHNNLPWCTHHTTSSMITPATRCCSSATRTEHARSIAATMGIPACFTTAYLHLCSKVGCGGWSTIVCCAPPATNTYGGGWWWWTSGGEGCCLHRGAVQG